MGCIHRKGVAPVGSGTPLDWRRRFFSHQRYVGREWRRQNCYYPGRRHRRSAPQVGRTCEYYHVEGRCVLQRRETLASGDIAGDVRVWSVESGKQLQQLGHQSVLWAVGFGADGMLATSGFGDGIRFWDAPTGKQLRHLRGLPGDVDSLAFSPDGKTLACGNSNGVISFWDVATTKQVRRTPGHLDRLNAVAISPDGRTLATASSDT